MSKKFWKAFNRTSLESKHLSSRPAAFSKSTFNRTSLESKLVQDYAVQNFIVHLLIEPVWNRNLIEVSGIVIMRGAFNRTSLESKLW